MILDIHGDVKYRFDFIEEIKTIFSIPIEDVIDVTEKWKNKFFSEYDLNDYWKYGGGGIVYVPYVMAEQIEIIQNVFPTSNITTRYSSKTVNPNFYGTIE
jgi:hypothetical protein